MDIKYIITKINNNIICSQYTGDDCQSLNIADTGSLTGNIYIGRVENVVKNINSAFVEIEMCIRDRNNAKYNKNCHLTFIKIIIDNISDYEYIHGKQNTLELLEHVENILIKAVEYRGVIGRTDKKWQFIIVIKDINNEPELRAFIELSLIHI